MKCLLRPDEYFIPNSKKDASFDYNMLSSNISNSNDDDDNDNNNNNNNNNKNKRKSVA